VVAIDTIATDIDDLAGLREEAIAARRDGFLAKAVIHPRHVDVVNAAFMPTEEEIAWSQKVVKAFDDNPDSGSSGWTARCSTSRICGRPSRSSRRPAAGFERKALSRLADSRSIVRAATRR
jgi:hypothetical protein